MSNDTVVWGTNPSDKETLIPKVNNYVYPTNETVGQEGWGTHLRDFELAGDRSRIDFECVQGSCGYCIWNNKVSNVKFSFYSEGLLQIARRKTNSCFGLCSREDYQWQFFPRYEIDYIKIENATTTCCCCCADPDVTTISVVKFKHTDSLEKGCYEILGQCLSQFTQQNCCQKMMDTIQSKPPDHFVEVNISPQTAEEFFNYAQNYLYNRDYDPERVFRHHYLSTSAKADWHKFLWRTDEIERMNKDSVGRLPIARTMTVPLMRNMTNTTTQDQQITQI